MTLKVAAVWTGPEQANFLKVLDDFKKSTGATVNFPATGNVTTTLHEDPRRQAAGRRGHATGRRVAVRGQGG